MVEMLSKVQVAPQPSVLIGNVVRRATCESNVDKEPPTDGSPRMVCTPSVSLAGTSLKSAASLDRLLVLDWNGNIFW